MPTLTDLTAPLRHSTDRFHFLGRLRDAAAASIDVVAPQSSLYMLPTAEALGFPASGIGGIEAGMSYTASALGQVAERLAIPVKYLRRLVTEQPWLASENVNTLASADARTALYRLWQADDGWMLRAMLSDSYGVFDNFTVLQALTSGFDASDLDLAEAEVEVDLTPDRFRMRIAVPSIAVRAEELLADYRSPFMGGERSPMIWAGMEISNSETGGGAFTIVPRAVVLACRNGMTRTTDIIRAVHLGGRLEAGVIDWSPETKQLNVELLASKVRDAVQSFVKVEYLQTLVDEAAAARLVAIERPGAAIELVRVAHQLSEAETDAVMDAFLRSSDASLFGLGQAVTAAAQGVTDGDRQTEMEAMLFPVLRNRSLALAH